MDTLMIGWTTTETIDQAQVLAKGLVEKRLAACVQVEGPVLSHYLWEGTHRDSDEYRLMVKFLKGNSTAVETWLMENHPYDTPQWVAVQAAQTQANYLAWAQSVAPTKDI